MKKEFYQKSLKKYGVSPIIHLKTFYEKVENYSELITIRDVLKENKTPEKVDDTYFKMQAAEIKTLFDKMGVENFPVEQVTASFYAGFVINDMYEEMYNKYQQKLNGILTLDVPDKEIKGWVFTNGYGLCKFKGKRHVRDLKGNFQDQYKGIIRLPKNVTSQKNGTRWYELDYYFDEKEIFKNPIKAIIKALKNGIR